MRASRSLPWRRISFPRRHGVRSFASIIRDSPGSKQHDPAPSSNSDFIQVSDEVREALESDKPVVALETAIYTHGFPSPENMELAVNLENKIREQGAVPATIGVVDGEPRVGLGYKGLYRLLQVADRGKALKLSRRDLPYILGMKATGKTMSGGTTVAGTMILAHLAGIDVFATGGIGGVHAGGELSMDVSADLRELGRTPVAVISSGCKSFLDIPRTLEYLETEGVSVATFADKKENEVDFPAFWSRRSGFKSPATVHNTREAAAIIHARSQLSLSSGLLFANPIPANSENPKPDMDRIIATAIEEARSSGATGRDNTPFILKRINQLTDGKSLTANKALIESNAIKAALVAVQLAEIRKKAPGGRRNLQEFSLGLPNDRVIIPTATQSFGNKRSYSTEAQPGVPRVWRDPNLALRQGGNDRIDIAVAGSTSLDLSCNPIVGEAGPDAAAPPLLNHTSNPAIITQTLGGVGCNIARAIHALHPYVRFCTLLADDAAGSLCWNELSKKGLATDTVKTVRFKGQRTARYVAVNDSKGDLAIAMADMGLFEAFGCEYLKGWEWHLRNDRPGWLVVDANWDAATLQGWIKAGNAAGAKIIYEPVSVVKAARLFRGDPQAVSKLPTFPHHHVHIATPNEAELVAMHKAAHDSGHFRHPAWQETKDALRLPDRRRRAFLIEFASEELVEKGIVQKCIDLLPYIPCIITKLGSKGVLLTKVLRHGEPLLMQGRTSKPILGKHMNRDNPLTAGVYVAYYPPAEEVPDIDVVNVNGVGDTFVGVLVAGLAKQKRANLPLLIGFAQKGSVMTLKSEDSVHPDLYQLAGQRGFPVFRLD